MAEFADSFETLSKVGPMVTIYGSSRMPRTSPCYAAATR